MLSNYGKQEIKMSEKRKNNTIFLMYMVTENYMKKHHLSAKDMLGLNQKYDILNYILECPDVFDNMTDREMVEELDAYVAENK